MVAHRDATLDPNPLEGSLNQAQAKGLEGPVGRRSRSVATGMRNIALIRFRALGVAVLCSREDLDSLPFWLLNLPVVLLFCT